MFIVEVVKKWLVLTMLAVVLIAGGGWYYLKGRPVVRETTRQEPGVSIAYTHEYTGSFVSLDATSRTLTLRGRDGKDYLFRVPQPLIDNRDEGVVGNSSGRVLIVEWNDARSPEQVLGEYRGNPTIPLNEGTALISIRRVGT